MNGLAVLLGVEILKEPLHCGFSLVELLLDWFDANTMLLQGEGYM